MRMPRRSLCDVQHAWSAPTPCPHFGAKGSSTRDFLDRLGEFSEVSKRYPDISFGKTYVNITLRPDEDSEDATLTDSDHAFAAAIDGLID